MIHHCLISLAANCNQKKNLAEVRRHLCQILSNTQYTQELWTEPIGNTRSNRYLNQLVRAVTTLEEDELCQKLKEFEIIMGRTASDRQQGIVRIDIDLLQYDEKRHHLRDWERPYVTQLLALY